MPVQSNDSTWSIGMVLTRLKNRIAGSRLGVSIRSKLGLIHKESEWAVRQERDEQSTRKLLHSTLKKDFNCVDIGANRGLFLRQFVELSPEGQHYAFEPLPELAEALINEFPDVPVMTCALSDRTAVDTFYHVSEMDGWSGLKKQDYPAAIKPIELQVQLKRLDDVLGADHRVDFIKIDVEGAEFQVLKGAASTLQRCRPVILFEHAKVHSMNYETMPGELYDFLVDACGFEVWDLKLSGHFSKKAFVDVCESSFASDYNRNAQTNFVAKPR